jgi:hypothetical protein
MGDDKEHTQRLELDAERTQAALTQTDAPHALARDSLHAATQKQKHGRALSPRTRRPCKNSWA